MCAQPSKVTNAPAANNNHENGNASGFDDALKNLAEAIAERKVEPICTTYLALRHEDREIPLLEIPEHVDRVAASKPGSARNMIISAFSHRHCVMCSNGTTPCRTCSGSGTAEGFECPACDGLGVEICSFCAGTGWSDRAEIPDEIRLAAVHRRIKHVKKDLARLDRMSEADISASVEKLQSEQRRELASNLLRLHARLTNLAGISPQASRRGDKADNNDEYVARFNVGAEKIRRFVEATRAKHPQAQE